MKKFYPLLLQSTLFQGMDELQMHSILNCLKATIKEYKKDAYIFYMGDNISAMGLVLSGSVHLSKEDYWGRKTILAEIPPANLFAESFACSKEKSPVNAYVAKNSTIMFLDIKKVLSVCSNSCIFHNTLIKNFVSVLAEKNIGLNAKIENLSQKTTKDKILAYLSNQSQLQNSAEFTIPFNRQELADYLSVDRSAMSFELGKLQKQGIIAFQKNKFIIKNKELL